MAGVTWKDVPIPERMQKLERDARGYPIPANIWRDNAGIAHFTINDHSLAEKFIKERRCPICGDEHDPTLWFVGGPLSAFHDSGAYFDQPMHEECAKYALTVCPWLAAPTYSRRIETRKVDPSHVKAGQLFHDPTMIPDRPPVFVAVQTAAYKSVARGKHVFHLTPKRPYFNVEFWRKGRMLSFVDACVYIPGLQLLAKGKSLAGLK